MSTPLRNFLHVSSPEKTYCLHSVILSVFLSACLGLLCEWMISFYYGYVDLVWSLYYGYSDLVWSLQSFPQGNTGKSSHCGGPWLRVTSSTAAEVFCTENVVSYEPCQDQPHPLQTAWEGQTGREEH